MSPAGYSGTPLPRKLGFREGMRVGILRGPGHLDRLLGPLPGGVRLDRRPRLGECGLLLAFNRDARDLRATLARVPSGMSPDAALWLCWPKKTSGVATDITGDDVRKAALAAGLVDVKVCAVDETWSGLKCVFRLRDRDALRRARGRKD